MHYFCPIWHGNELVFISLSRTERERHPRRCCCRPPARAVALSVWALCFLPSSACRQRRASGGCILGPRPASSSSSSCPKNSFDRPASHALALDAAAAVDAACTPKGCSGEQRTGCLRVWLNVSYPPCTADRQQLFCAGLRIPRTEATLALCSVPDPESTDRVSPGQRGPGVGAACSQHTRTPCTCASFLALPQDPTASQRAKKVEQLVSMCVHHRRCTGASVHFNSQAVS